MPTTARNHLETSPLEEDTLTITLSDRSPVQIHARDWPVIARAYDHDGGHYESQALETALYTVREHADGRRLVYAWTKAGPGGQRQSFRPSVAGYLLSAKEASDSQATVRAIWRVSGVVGWAVTANACVAGLPAEVI